MIRAYQIHNAKAWDGMKCLNALLGSAKGLGNQRSMLSVKAEQGVCNAGEKNFAACKYVP